MANNWRGCKNVFMQGHGDWADPDIYIENEDGLFVFNYWDIEDALWNDFLESEGIEEKDTYNKRGNISKAWENKFSKYCRDNAYDYITYDLLSEYSYFTDEQCSKDGKFCSWHVDDVKEYDAEQEEDDDDDDDDFDYDDIEESCSGGKNEKKVTEGLGPEPTNYAKKVIADAEKVGLWDYLDDYMLNFCFNSPEELKQNANKIRKWIKLYPTYFICKEPADAYGDDSEDGYLYFVSDMDEVPKEERMSIDSFENGFYESVNNNSKKKLKEDINSGSKYPTSPEECLNLLASATKEFANAYLKLTEQWDMCDTYCQNDARKSGLDIDINDAMVDGYPFERSFDDYSLEVMEWSDSVTDELNNIRDSIEE